MLRARPDGLISPSWIMKGFKAVPGARLPTLIFITFTSTVTPTTSEEHFSPLTVEIRMNTLHFDTCLAADPVSKILAGLNQNNRGDVSGCRLPKNNPIRFVFLYDLDIFGLGRWVDDFETDKDMHGLQLQGPVYYYWLMNSRIYHNQGDSIQCSNSNIFDFKHATRPHYVYIGGNEFYENYENGYDSKGCYHVIFSENYIHDFFNAIKPANSTAVTTAQDGESYLGTILPGL